MPKLLKLLLIAAFFNALSWIVLIPIWQYPDEQAHFVQVQDIAELGKTPVGVDTSEEIAVSEKILGTERDGFGNNRYTYHPEFNIDYSDTNEGLFENYIESFDKSSRTNLVKKEATHNPPLYYFLGALFYKAFSWGDLFTRVFAIRIMSAILFLVLVFVAYKIAFIIFENELLRIALPTLVAFKPMLVFASTGVLPDVLTNLLFTLIIYLSLKILLGGLSKKLMLKVFIVILLGALTRQQFLISLPIIFIAIFYQFFNNRKQFKKYIFPAVSFLFTGFLLTFLIPQLAYLRNLSLPEIAQPDMRLLFSNNFIEHLKISLEQTFSQTLPWYWGVYRWLSYTPPPIVYQIINRILIVAVIGVLIAIFRPIIKRSATYLDTSLYFLIIASSIYYAVIIIWDYYFRLDHNFSFGIQGRYFFPLIVAHLAVILIGFVTVLEMVLKNYAKWAVFLIVLLIILFNDISLFFVSKSYYSIASLAIYVRQAGQYKPELFKGVLPVLLISLSVLLQVVFISKLAKNISKK